MRRLLPLLALAALVLPLAAAGSAGAAPASSPAMTDRNATDTVLANEFLRLLQAKDSVGLRRFFSPAFLLQRPDGQFLRREQYIANPAVVESYAITDVVGTRSPDGNVRVVRYTVTTSSIINGQPVTKDPVARLSTYVWDPKADKAGAWRIIAHANFTAVAPAAT